MTLQEFKAKFDAEIHTGHIKYDWDSGHSYSYIDHPIIADAEEQLNDEEADDFRCYTDTWLYDNDQCPPCFPRGECGCNEDDYEGWYDARIANGDTFEFLNKIYPIEVSRALMAKADEIMDEKLSG